MLLESLCICLSSWVSVQSWDCNPFVVFSQWDRNQSALCITWSDLNRLINLRSDRSVVKTSIWQVVEIGALDFFLIVVVITVLVHLATVLLRGGQLGDVHGWEVTQRLQFEVWVVDQPLLVQVIVLEELSHLVADHVRWLSIHVGIESGDSLFLFENGCLLVGHECLIALHGCRFGTEPDLIYSFAAAAACIWIFCLLWALLVMLWLVGVATLACWIFVTFEQEEFVFFEKQIRLWLLRQEIIILTWLVINLGLFVCAALWTLLFFGTIQQLVLLLLTGAFNQRKLWWHSWKLHVPSSLEQSILSVIKTVAIGD